LDFDHSFGIGKVGDMTLLCRADAVRAWLEELNFTIERTLAVSHFRMGLPGVFVKEGQKSNVRMQKAELAHDIPALFKCPECGWKNWRAAKMMGLLRSRSPLRFLRDFLCDLCALCG
jgi:hypothetical protein